MTATKATLPGCRRCSDESSHFVIGKESREKMEGDWRASLSDVEKLPLRSSRDVGSVDADFHRAAWLPSPRSFQAYPTVPLYRAPLTKTIPNTKK